MTVANGAEPQKPPTSARSPEDVSPEDVSPGPVAPGQVPAEQVSERQAQDPTPTIAGVAAGYAEKAGLHRRSDGNIDVLKSAGGVQGIAESILPGLMFLVCFTVTRDLGISLVAALAAAAAFTVVRLVQRRPLTQALAGIVGVGISAWLANTTGRAEDFYVLGFFTNIGYILAMVISIAIKWPIAGLLFGFIRSEGLEWRKDPRRVKVYALGTWVIVTVLALRLVVQVPLYFLGEEGLAALATTRLLMGAPLYILGLWVAWLLTRPVPATPQPSKPSSSGA